MARNASGRWARAVIGEDLARSDNRQERQERGSVGQFSHIAFVLRSLVFHFTPYVRTKRVRRRTKRVRQRKNMEEVRRMGQNEDDRPCKLEELRPDYDSQQFNEFCGYGRE